MAEMDTDRQSRFLSGRWRVMLPLFGLLLVAAMLVGYSIIAAPVGSSSDPLTASAQLQLMRLLVAGLAGAVVITVFIGLNSMIGRINRVRTVVDALAAGSPEVRTGMTAIDEIGALGAAVDQYAEQVEARHDQLREMLRRQRRETEHLTAVLEAIPDGIIVQDTDGHVVHINDKARVMLGSQHARGVDLNELTSTVTDVLGLALAPGVYSLGDPQHVEMEGRMVSAQAAALVSLANRRVGTVIVLRDITDEVRRERAREKLVNRMEKEVQVPLMAQSRHNPTANLSDFAREITRHSAALQKMIVEMRELTADFRLRGLSEQQRPLLLDTLMWALANEWQQVAQAANLSLRVMIEQPGLHVLGDERRLRWALGNIVDNAIKYTPPGGEIVLEIRGEVNGMAHLRLRDNGVGIGLEELPHVFTRFYRGNPVMQNGRMIHVPGTGQGLSIAKQIIEMHGGSIRLKSTQWVGTAVYVALPLTAPVSLEMPRLYQEMEDETLQLRAKMDGETVKMRPQGK